MMTDTSILLRRGLFLKYITLGWNVVGTAIVIAAAIAAHSVALVGFGLDSPGRDRRICRCRLASARHLQGPRASCASFNLNRFFRSCHLYRCAVCAHSGLPARVTLWGCTIRYDGSKRTVNINSPTVVSTNNEPASVENKP